MTKNTKGYLLSFVLLTVALPCGAQQWEIGGALGYGFQRDLTVSRQGAEAKAGFRHGVLFSVWGGQDLYQYVSGELRYTYQNSNLKLSGNGTEANLAGDSHAVHYDLLFHVRPKGARIRPFAAAGGGIRIFRGSEDEPIFQPLSDLAVLTRTRQVKPMISVGGGLRAYLSNRANLRIEIRDYLSPFPKDVVAPVPGAKLRGWLHDFVPTVGIELVF